MELGVNAVMLPELDFDEQVALCSKLGVRYYQYRPRIIPEDRRGQPFSYWGNHKFDLTPRRLLREGAALTRQLREAGLEPWGTAPNLTVDASDEAIIEHVEAAAAADAGAIRCQPPPYPSEPFDYPEYLERTVARYADVIERLSWPVGIKLLVETHARTSAASPGLAERLCASFSPKRVGVIFDLANFPREGAVEPVLAVSVLRRYIDCCHIGGSRYEDAEPDAAGRRRREPVFCAIEQSDLYLPDWLAALRDAQLDPPLIIEDYRAGLDSATRLGQSAAALKKMRAERATR